MDWASTVRWPYDKLIMLLTQFEIGTVLLKSVVTDL